MGGWGGGERERDRERDRQTETERQRQTETDRQTDRQTETETERLLVGCLTSQQHVSPGRVCSDNCMCCHTDTEVADPTFYLTQSQYTDTLPTIPEPTL